ncbi:mCG148333 [Mus musculus]|nr:mCG148333 [Mus musculus]
MPSFQCTYRSIDTYIHTYYKKKKKQQPGKSQLPSSVTETSHGGQTKAVTIAGAWWKL